MIVRIYNTDDEIDVRELFEMKTAYWKWLEARPEIIWEQLSNKDYLHFDNDEDAIAFKLRFPYV